MNSVLISVGAALVVVLTAALVGPSFVNWNGYRASIEAEGARLSGRPIAIGGDLDVRLLPEPVIRIGQVQVLRADSDEPLIEAEAANINLSLSALLLGRIEVVDLALKAPILRVVTRGDALDWGAEDPLGGAAVAVFRRITAEGARVEFADAENGVGLVLEGVELEVTGSGARGPFKIAGRYGEADEETGRRPGFSLSLGTVSQSGPVKLAGRIDLAPAGELSLDGALRSLGRAPGFEGKVRLDRPFGEAGSDEAARPRLVAVAEADIGVRHAALKDLSITLSGLERTIAMGGAGRADFAGRPSFRLQLATRQIDLDALGAEARRPALMAELDGLVGAGADWLERNQARGEVLVAADGAILGGELVRAVSVAATVEPDLMRITAFEGAFPGQTTIRLIGQARWGEAPAFSGELIAETVELGRFAAWAAPEDNSWVQEVFGASRGRLSVRGGLEADADAIALQGLEGFLNQSPFSGELVVERIGADRPARLRADLAFDRIELDRYLPAEARLIDIATATGLAAAPEFELTVRAKRLAWRGRTAEGVAASVRHTGGAIEVDRLAVDDLAGAAIDLTGRIVPGADGPTGTLDVTLKSEDLAAFAAALGDDLPPFARLVAASPIAPRLSDLSVGLRGGTGTAGSALRVRGTVSGVAVEAELSSDAPASRAGEGALELTATLNAANLRAVDGLAAALGLGGAALPDRRGTLEVNASGTIAKGLEAVARLEAAGAELVAEAEIGPDLATAEATLKGEGASAAALAVALGLPAPTVDGRVALTAKASYRPGRLGVQDIRVRLGDNAITASLDADLATDPAQLRLTLDAETAELPWIAGAIFAPPSAERAGPAEAGGRRATWSTDLVDIDRLSSLVLAATGTVGALEIAEGHHLEDARYTLAIGGGALNLVELSGRIDGGALNLTGRIGGRGEALLDVEGQLALKGGVVGRLLADGSGRALLGGTADVEASFTASGRSLLSLVSSLTGSGEMKLSALEVPRLDAALVIGGADSAADDEVIEALIETARGGSTALGDAALPVEATNGRIKIGPAALSGPGLAGQATSFLDLPSRRFDQELVLESTEGRASQLAVVHAGPLGEVGREIDLTDLPLLGSARWTEPMDGYDPSRARDAAMTAEEPDDVGPTAAVPDPSGEEAPPDGVGPQEASTAPQDRGRPAAGGKADAEGLVPSRLIDKQVVDLPILERAAPTQ